MPFLIFKWIFINSNIQKYSSILEGVVANLIILSTWRYRENWVWYPIGFFFIGLVLPCLFSPNRSIFSKLTDALKYQGTIGSLFSIFGTIGRTLGPVYMGYTAGRFPITQSDEHVAPFLFQGLLAICGSTLVLNVVILFISCPVENYYN